MNLFLFSSSEFKEKNNTIIDKIPPNWFRKKAWVELQNKNPIPVNVCQAIIQAHLIISQFAAIIFGKFIYAHKSSHQIGIGLTIFMKLTQIRKVMNMKRNSVDSRFRFIWSSIVQLELWFFISNFLV